MIRAIVTDIEGTTSSLSFVKDVLFPYARQRMAEFVRAHHGEPAVAEQLNAVRAEVGKDGDDQQVVEQLIRWIDEDRKVTALKALQGMIWEQGYRDGSLVGQIYEDAARNLAEWQKLGLKLYVFSSGSVQAQKLLFGHSEAGDLTAMFSGYFDTRVGAKRDPAAYEAIARDIGLPPDEVLFLSDIKTELDAARDAGMRTTWLVRDGALDPDADHPQARNFDEITLVG